VSQTGLTARAGTSFSRRPAAILALLAVYTGSVVLDQAERWLTHIKVRPTPAPALHDSISLLSAWSCVSNTSIMLSGIL
jgi:hypothetical protein